MLRSPTTSTESPSASSAATYAAGVELRAGNGEVRAVAVGRRRVLGVGDARGRVVRQRGRRLAAQRRDHPGEDDDHAVTAGVDHARLAQDRQQLGPAAQRRLAGRDRPFEHVGQYAVLLGALGVGPQPRRGLVSQPRGHVRGHVAHDREHRSLGRRADRGVSALRRARHRGAEQDRIDQLARARDQLLGRAADELGEDDAAVAARAQQRGADDRVDDLVAADLVERPVDGRQPVDLLQAGPQRERHVVARVAVGDREDVEVVDLLSARLQVRESAFERDAEADETRVGRDDRPAGRRANAAGARAPW